MLEMRQGINWSLPVARWGAHFRYTSHLTQRPAYTQKCFQDVAKEQLSCCIQKLSYRAGVDSFE
jgi:hypothetical protein